MTATTGSEDIPVTAAKADMRAKAQAFSARWRNATSEQSDKQPFWDDFFRIFGVERRQVAVYEALAERATTGKIGWIDLLLPGQMAVEHKSAGKSLNDAMNQLVDYLPSLPKAEHPWLLVVSDFASFQWRNLDTGESGAFSIDDLHDNLELFWWLAGHRRPHVSYSDEVAANLAATELLAELHDALKRSGYPDSSLREWMTRILFCLFADDTAAWDRGAFAAYLALHSASDGHDLGDVIERVFRVLNTSEADRPRSLDEDLAAFTFINGDLFATTLWPVTGTKEIRDALLRASSFDWAEISPAIFGSLFQNVMTATERHELGAHYTTEENILRTLRPLFLDDLESELRSANSIRALTEFHDKLAHIRALDPAAGCGNFLVIAYREIRRLETECLRELTRRQHATGQRVMSLDLLCKVNVGQFYGIEIEEFPARIATTALYLADHIENRKVSAEFGEHFVRFPIPDAPHIVIGNALRIPWVDVLPASECTYVFGNPPFAGQKTRSPEQTDDLRYVWGTGFARWLDYVTGWWRLAADYLAGSTIRAAFVSTNSIVQGEQVARLWKPLLDRGVGIDFAHRTFAWTSEARGKAHVHVVIIGFSVGAAGPVKLVFDYPKLNQPPVVTTAKQINPYLLDGPPILVESRSSGPLSPVLPAVDYGSKPSDGGALVVELGDKPPESDPAWKVLRPYIGARELMHGRDRLCIWMTEPDPELTRTSTWLRNRLERSQQFREASTADPTRKLAAEPWRFFHCAQPAVPYVAIPRHGAENREWFVVRPLEPTAISSDALFTVVDPDGFVFAVLSSAAFTAWLKTVGGRIKSDPRFSGPIVYNTFPLPEVDEKLRTRIVAAGEAVKSVRASFPDRTLAELYDPLSVPPKLRAAHRELDIAVDRAFTDRGRPSTIADRMALLFPAYEATIGRLREEAN